MSNFPLVICAIFKNEGLYIKEWIEFHLLMGVKKFYLYNNNSTDDYEKILNPYINRGIVNLINWPMQAPSVLSVNNPQLFAYADFIKRMNNTKIWAAFIDIDEFLFSPIGSLSDYFEQIDNPIAIGVNWMCFGSSGKLHYEDLPVIKRFTMRPLSNIWLNTHIKSIIRMDQQVTIGGDPHFFQVENGTYNENFERINGPWSPHVSNKLRINHYKTKSKDEWIKRQQNGKADNANYVLDWNTYNEVQIPSVDDRTIQKFLPYLMNRS
jgi:hypothetical protein